MSRSLSEAAKYVIEELKRLGIEVPQGSRLMCMYNSVCNSDGSSRGLISEDMPNFQIARETLRDLTILEFYFDKVKGYPNDDEQKSKLKEIVSGTTLPQDSGANTSARNAQSELFVFAVCMNAGLKPDFQEPDVTCKLDGKKYGIAVKRIKNLGQLEKRVNEGANQVKRTGLPGFVSIDVTMAMNPGNKSIFTNECESKVKEYWVGEFRKMVNKYYSNLCQRTSDKNVLGIFLHEHCPVRFGKEYNLRSMTYGVSTACNEAEKAEWEKFKDVFLHGLPNLII